MKTSWGSLLLVRCASLPREIKTLAQPVKTIFLLFVSAVMLLIATALSVSLPPATPPVAQPLTAQRHTGTLWQVRTSVVYEAFGLLNALTGDPLAAPQYPSETARFAQGLAPTTQAALNRLAAYRQQSGTVLSAVLARNFSSANPETLDAAIALARDPQSLRQSLLQADRCAGCVALGDTDRQQWAGFAAILPDVAAALEHLRAAGFEAYWQEQIQPGLAASAAETQTYAQGYNIVPVIEHYLGYALPGETVTLYMVYFQRPYGHRLTGAQFVTVPGLTQAGQVQTAIHELLHPAYNPSNTQARGAAQRLSANQFFRQAFENRDPRYPYNNWNSYVDENAVRALEQVICAQVGLPQRWGWQGEDGGMHVLAPVLVDLMQAQQFPQNGETFQAFLIRNVDDGTLLSVEQATAIYRQVVKP
jgi:hypothetical protein